jgi:hypothetical protein
VLSLLFWTSLIKIVMYQCIFMSTSHRENSLVVHLFEWKHFGKVIYDIFI